jgi:threonylcarbamoyladenosine tRNA methylthiotransferase MtaB
MRVAVATLGCKVNQYDSATIESRLRREGCTIVPFAAGADVYVVNSCTVTDRADAESRRLARRARRFNPQGRVVMTGCFAQASPRRAAIPEVDYAVGLNRLDDLVRAVRGEIAAAQRVLTDDLRAARSVRTLGADTFVGQTRAFLKIQEGCDLFCTFCIVPFSRGRSRSVPPRQVFSQLELLAARGFQEVVLTGVHLGGYGSDLEPEVDLCGLLEMIAERSPLPRVRLSSLDPPEVTSRLLDLLRSSPVFCPHLHIPVQAAQDEILRRMRRQYDTAFLREVSGEVRRSLPDAAIGTDVIAGFPGETDAQFEATMELLRELPFTSFHVFPYSRRTGTTAAKLAGQVPSRVITERAGRLRALSDEKQVAFADRFVGRVLRVLVEHTPPRPAWLCGYSRNYLRVECPGDVAMANRELSVHVEAGQGARLVGRMVGRECGVAV